MGGVHPTGVIGDLLVTGMVTIMATGGVMPMDTGQAIALETGIHRADPHTMPAELQPTMYITTGRRESGGREIQLMTQRQEIG